MEWAKVAAKETLEESEITEVIEGFAARLEEIERQVAQDAWDAYSDLMVASALFSRVFQLRWPKLPNLDKKLRDWIKRVQRTVAKVARGLGSQVSGYSIGVGFPMGISVSISFRV